jgi:hypothetical protein
MDENKKKELELVKQNVKMILNFKKQYILDAEIPMPINEFDNTMKHIFPKFCEEYPTLYKMVFTNSDINLLYKMIDMIMNICDGNTTMDKAKDEMGEMLAEQYLYPQFGKPTKK